MKVALTGATGHLGMAVLHELHAQGYIVRVLARNAFPFASDVEVVHGDIHQPDELVALMKGCEALIHCAARISIDGDPRGDVYRTNVDGTRSVMHAAKQCGIRRVIHISSVHVFQQVPLNETLDEQRQLVDHTASAYDRSKRLGQEIALSMNTKDMEVLVMNPTGIIGPYDYKPSRAGRMIIDMVKRRWAFLMKGGFDFCDSRDVAHAIVNALQMGSAGESYLLSGKWYSLHDIAAILSTTTSVPIRTVLIPTTIVKAVLPFVKLYGRVSGTAPVFTGEALDAVLTGNRSISHAKAQQALRFSPRPLEETLKDTVGWFEENGYLKNVYK